MARRNEVRVRTELGRQLEKERDNQGLSKEAWYLHLQISKPTYLDWLRGLVDLPISTVIHLAARLEVPSCEVLDWIEADWVREKSTLRALGLTTHRPLAVAA